MKRQTPQSKFQNAGAMPKLTSEPAGASGSARILTVQWPPAELGFEPTVAVRPGDIDAAVPLAGGGSKLTA